MAIKDISQHHGTVRKCDVCTNSDPRKPMDCRLCFGHGFVAECTNCGGKGHTVIPVAGVEVGTMKSVCAACGGVGFFGVKRPADGKEPEAVTDEKKELATA